MMKLRFLKMFAFLVLAILHGGRLTAGSAVTGEIPNENRCYDPAIRSIQLFREGFELSPPVIPLNGSEKLMIRFDYLGEETRRFRFTILHCEAGWNTSTDLSVSDFIDGFREENIDQYEYSYNTTIPYTHFHATFPTESMKPRISGNYLLIVYDEDPSRIAFTARFMVTEDSPLIIRGAVNAGAHLSPANNRQQVDFVVGLNGFRITDVEREVRIVLTQNNRWDNAVMVSKPRFARTEELDYRYDEAISFNGGNQFRNFDTKSLKYQSERIARIAFDTSTQVYLQADMPRPYKQYINDKDLNGSFFIKSEDNAQNSDIEADYAWVHFYVPIPTLITDATIHIAGDLTSWQMDESSRLYFNPEHQGYEITLLLKQGYYNYQYLIRKKDAAIADGSLIEGNHWETENDYHIMFYFHENGSLFDRLMNVTTLNSQSR